MVPKEESPTNEGTEPQLVLKEELPANEVEGAHTPAKELPANEGAHTPAANEVAHTPAEEPQINEGTRTPREETSTCDALKEKSQTDEVTIATLPSSCYKYIRISLEPLLLCPGL